MLIFLLQVESVFETIVEEKEEESTLTSKQCSCNNDIYHWNCAKNALSCKFSHREQMFKDSSYLFHLAKKHDYESCFNQ